MDWDDENAYESLSIGWRVNAVATVDFQEGKLVLTWDEDGYRSTADDHLPRGVPGVYVWYGVMRRPDGDTYVKAAYVGEASDMRRRFDQYASAKLTTTPVGTEERLVFELSELKSEGCQVNLGLAYDIFVAGRPWYPAQWAQRLMVESAMVVHGAVIRGHRMINRAASRRATHLIREWEADQE